MTSKQFWKLTFYEWSIWLLRIRLLNNRRQNDHELMIRLARRMMLVSAKVMGAKNVKEEDFWRMEEDRKDVNSTDLTDEEIKERNIKINALIASRQNKNGRNSNQ